MPKTILIIEDSNTMRHLVGLVLAGQDVTMVEADNATDGINSAINLEPDLIIADESMDGKNALEICQLLKREYSLDYIPFIVLSGQIQKFDQSAALLAGVDEVMPKPFEAEEFVKSVMKQLEIYEGRRPEKRDETQSSGDMTGKEEEDAAADSHNGEDTPAMETAVGAGNNQPSSPIPGITYKIYEETRGDSAVMESYQDPIANFFGDEEAQEYAEEPSHLEQALPSHMEVHPNDPVENTKDVLSPAAPDVEKASTDDLIDNVIEKALRPAGPGSLSMQATGPNLADEDLERLVTMEIKRRLSKIRLEDLESEIKTIFADAVEGTVKRMLPQVKTEIILTIVKMLRNK